MSKAIPKEGMALLKEASEMFSETGCVLGIDGEEMPAETIVPAAKEYIRDIDDPEAIYDPAIWDTSGFALILSAAGDTRALHHQRCLTALQRWARRRTYDNPHESAAGNVDPGSAGGPRRASNLPQHRNTLRSARQSARALGDTVLGNDMIHTARRRAGLTSFPRRLL